MTDPSQFGLLLLARSRRAYVTWVVIAANCAAFLFVVGVARALHGFDTPTLARLGALSASNVAAGEWWRLINSMFLHGGLVHLGLNMLAFLQVGLIVERLYGSAAFGAIYLLSGIAGGCASVYWRQDIVSVGASGAVFGVYAALLAYLVLQRGSVPLAVLRRLAIGALVFVVYSLASGIGASNVDNAAHVGGLVAGLVLGAGAARPLAMPWSVRSLNRATAVALVVVAAGLALLRLAPDPEGDYRRAMELSYALKALAQADDEADRRLLGLKGRVAHGQLSPDEAFVEMERELLPLWDEQLGRLHQLQQREPGQEALREKLIRYAQLRRGAMRGLMEAIRDDDPAKAEGARLRNDEAQRIIIDLLRQSQSAKPP